MGNSGNSENDIVVKTNHEHTITFAIHYQYTSGTWYTTGWWTVTNTSSCRPNITTENRYIYFHAHCNTCGAEWGNGHSYLCHKFKAFDISSEPSDRTNYEYKNFSEGDIGEDFCEYTYTFL